MDLTLDFNEETRTLTVTITSENGTIHEASVHIPHTDTGNYSPADDIERIALENAE